MIDRLPNWNFNNLKPSFNDLESATAVEMVYKLYGKSQELIDDYNKFINNINAHIEEYETSVDKNIEVFEVAIRQEFQDFIDTVDMKIQEHEKDTAYKLSEQDKQINDAIKYMKDNLGATVTMLVEQMKESGELTDAIIQAFKQMTARIEVIEELKISQFKTVAEMKASSTLIANQCVETLGYYEANDGGGAKYLIRAKTENDVDDAGSIHVINDVLVAELIIESELNVKQFGAKGDSETDDTNAIQKAIDFAYSLAEAYKYNSYKVKLPKGKYVITSQLTLNSSSLNSSEFSNIILQGEGQGTTCLLANFTENGNVLYLNASSKCAIKDISFKNKSSSDYDITALKIDGSSMMIDLINLFAYSFYVGFDVNICVGNLTNCFANSCNCGFKTRGTGTNLNNCYASQTTVKNGVNEYEGCGYYIQSHYSKLNSCASDSNKYAYYIIRNGVTLDNCGMEGCEQGFIINIPTTLYESPVIINGYLFNNVSKPTISIISAQKVIIMNHNFSLDFDYVEIGESLPSNVVEYIGCNFYVVNTSLYPTNIFIPLENRSRERGTIYNFDGKMNIGKARKYVRELKWRVYKTGESVYNGHYGGIKIKISSFRCYSTSETSLNEEIMHNYNISGTSVTKTKAKYDETKFTLNVETTDDYLEYTLTPLDETIAHSGDLFCCDIDIFDNTLFDLNHNTSKRLIVIEGIDY